ncbi:hypothetical protein HPB47_002692 [Ixodes persulcatus]|uniref:Uncharacterized protein n=1 Tax=Ixodes persulcatus TaxID=34615 RepID=A0AC60PKR0_IXOPE|nr:hypothetical protein HPB47_002692 [Ixodes persulcatus]
MTSFRSRACCGTPVSTASPQELHGRTSILYWAQDACCTESTAEQIHRSWATFIWRSSMERTRRSNLFLSLEA